jgi:hypothetical protein
MEFVNIEELKRHLHITNDEDDDYLKFLIRASVSKAEIFLGFTLADKYTEDTIPDNLILVLMLECGNKYDMERNSYQPTNTKKSDIFERELMPYKNMIW